jgi:uncharacterized protein (TIGR03435 family)
MKRLIATASLVLALRAPAQEFEVASVRPHAGPLHSIMDFKISGPRLTLGAYNIAQLVIEAYHLQGMWQISFSAFPGRDDQMSVYYDITARAPDDASHSRDQFRKMLQALLTGRFRLSSHREMKQTPVYALVPGKNISKLKKATGDTDCSVHVGVVPGGQRYELLSCTVESLVSVLNNGGVADRPVIDRSGLLGKYDFRFTATPASFRRSQPELTDVSPFSAMRDLGLRLQAQTEPFEILVIDHFEKLTPN